MDAMRFDEFAKAVARRTSRRAVLKAFAGLAGSSLVGAVGLGTGRAQDDVPVGDTATPTMEDPTATATEIATETPIGTPTETALPTDTPTFVPTEPVPTETATPSATPTAPNRSERGTPTPTVRPTEKLTATPKPEFNASATPTLSLSPTSGTAGSAVRATIAGFTSRENVTLYWYDGSTERTLLTSTVSSTGRLGIEFKIPKTYRGAHKVRVKGAGGKSADASCTVNRSLVLSPKTAAPGATITTKLYGFNKNAAVKVRWFSGPTSSSAVRSIRTGTTDATGTLVTTFKVPTNAVIGKHRVDARETVSDGSAASAVIVELAAPNCTSGCVTCQAYGTCADVCTGDACTAVTASWTAARTDANFSRMAAILVEDGFVSADSQRVVAIRSDAGLVGLISVRLRRPDGQLADLLFFKNPQGVNISQALVHSAGAVTYGLYLENGVIQRYQPELSANPGSLLQAEYVAPNASDESCKNCIEIQKASGGWDLGCDLVGLAACTVLGLFTLGVAGIACGVASVAVCWLGESAGCGHVCRCNEGFPCDECMACNEDSRECVHKCDNLCNCPDGQLCQSAEGICLETVWIGTITVSQVFTERVPHPSDCGAGYGSRDYQVTIERNATVDSSSLAITYDERTVDNDFGAFCCNVVRTVDHHGEGEWTEFIPYRTIWTDPTHFQIMFGPDLGVSTTPIFSAESVEKYRGCDTDSDGTPTEYQLSWTYESSLPPPSSLPFAYEEPPQPLIGEVTYQEVRGEYGSYTSTISYSLRRVTL